MTDMYDNPILNERHKVWGDAVEAFNRIALTWSGILGYEVTPINVCDCMIALKGVRTSINPLIQDNYDDTDGYAELKKKLYFAYLEEIESDSMTEEELINTLGVKDG